MTNRSDRVSKVKPCPLCGRTSHLQRVPVYGHAGTYYAVACNHKDCVFPGTSGVFLNKDQWQDLPRIPEGDFCKVESTVVGIAVGNGSFPLKWFESRIDAEMYAETVNNAARQWFRDQKESKKMSSNAARKYTKNGGIHLKVVRQWMQRKFRNGETVTWGSNEPLSGTSLTPNVMERLAADIAEAVFDDLARKHWIVPIPTDLLD